MKASRLERLLPVACIVAAAVLFASELMVLFHLTPPGGEPLDDQVLAREQHGNALFVIATFAALATIAAVWAGSRPAALGVAVMGVMALLVFLLMDLPDAGQVGTVDDARQSFIDAEAVPQAGFWMEMLGALGLALSGGALATMAPEQLASIRGNIGRRGRPKRSPQTTPSASPTSKSGDAV